MLSIYTLCMYKVFATTLCGMYLINTVANCDCKDSLVTESVNRVLCKGPAVSHSDVTGITSSRRRRILLLLLQLCCPQTRSHR